MGTFTYIVIQAMILHATKTANAGSAMDRSKKSFTLAPISPSHPREIRGPRPRLKGRPQPEGRRRPPDGRPRQGGHNRPLDGRPQPPEIPPLRRRRRRVAHGQPPEIDRRPLA